MVILSMITKNSLEKVGAFDFKRVLHASLQVPYKVIILVDDSNTSSTLNFVRAFSEENDKELIVTRSRLYGYSKPTRATARQTAIDLFFENFSEEWLFFLDDDFIIREGWWSEALKHIPNSKVGLIWGVDFCPRWTERQLWLRARGLDEFTIAVNNFRKRGGLHDTLLRRESIEGLRLPPWLNVYEDAWIKKYIECRGYEWKILRTGGDHLRAGAEGYTDYDFKIEIAMIALLGLDYPSIKLLLKNFFSLPAYLYYSAKAFGVEKMISKGITIWLERLKYRFALLRHRKTLENICSLILSGHLDEKLVLK